MNFEEQQVNLIQFPFLQNTFLDEFILHTQKTTKTQTQQKKQKLKKIKGEKIAAKLFEDAQNWFFFWE